MVSNRLLEPGLRDLHLICIILDSLLLMLMGTYSSKDMIVIWSFFCSM